MPSPSRRAPFVGRERELDLLLACLDEARGSGGGAAFVAGEPGIGKTRLLTELASRARRLGWTVLAGRAYETAGMPPYLPFSEVLREYARGRSAVELRTALDAGAAGVARLVPELRDTLLNVPEAPALGPEQERFRLFEGIAEALLGIARAEESGLLLILDDLHWGDTASLLLLQHLAHKLADAPLLLALGYRTVDPSVGAPLQEVLAAIIREGIATHILLPALTVPETAALVLGATGMRPAPALADAVQAATEGNPFFIEQVVRQLQAEGRDLADERIALADWGIPEGVRQVIGRRLARLSSEANRLLQAAAVVGDAFELAIVSSVSRIDPDALEGVIEETVAAGLIREQGTACQFSHALVYQTVYDGLSLPRKERLHRQVAGVIERLHARNLGPHLAALAVHYRLAGPSGDPEKAVDYTLRAGAAAKAAFAYEQAAAHWQAALALLEQQGSAPERRAALLAELGDLMLVTGVDYWRGLEATERALALYEGLGLAVPAAEMHIRLGQYLSTWTTLRAGVTDIPRALAHYRAAEAVLAVGPAGAPLARLSIGVAWAALYTVGTEEGLTASGHAMVIAEQIGDEWLWAEAAAVHSQHLWVRGRPQEAQVRLEQAWEVADRLDHGMVCFTIAWIRSIWADTLGDPREAAAWCERELADPRLGQAPWQREILGSYLIKARSRSGELPAARRVLGELGLTAIWPYATVAFWEGDWERATELWTSVLEQAHRGGIPLNENGCSFDLARVYRARGDYARAAALYQEALTYVEGQGLAYVLQARPELALLYAETGRAPAAQAQLASCREVMAEGEDWRGLAGRVFLAEAVVAAAEGRFTQADRVFEEARAVFRRFALPWDEAEALRYWAQSLDDAQQPQRARERRDMAIALYRRLGASERWLERVRLRAPGRPASTGGAAAAYPAGLSEREVEVMRLLAAGKTNREIALALVISPNTAAFHVRSILNKTGAANRTEAAAFAHHHLTDKPA